MSLVKKTVLITGSSSGIGHVCAQGLAKRGHLVIASARKARDVERLRAEGLESVQLDLDDPASIETGLAQALELTGGGLDVLFNNGAYAQPGALEDISRDALREQLETNLLGWHDLTRRVVPIMRAQGQGRIVQNSSVLGFAGMPYRGAYVTSKFALEGLSDVLRLELRPAGIHVCLIEPGPILSRLRANAEQAYRKHIDRDASVYRDVYLGMEARLQKEGPAQPFTLPPEAVLKKLVHAVESRRPRPRYYVTFPTHLFGSLKRVLSTGAMDAILGKASRGGRG